MSNSLAGSDLSVSNNLLPYDGQVYFMPAFLTDTQASLLFATLIKKANFVHDELTMFGKKIVTARKVAMYAQQPLSYRYSGQTRYATQYFEELATLQQRLVDTTGEPFNACLLNLYHDGTEQMGWHADNEKEIAPQSAIASISLGAPRRFVFKHRQTKEKVELVLPSGSLVIMKGTVQQHWLHSLPKMMRVKEPRINLTYRLMR